MTTANILECCDIHCCPAVAKIRADDGASSMMKCYITSFRVHQ